MCLTLFVLADTLFSPAILGESATYLGIAICHTVFNVICTTLMLPAAGLLEKPEAVSAMELARDFSWDRVRKDDISMDSAVFTPLCGG